MNLGIQSGSNLLDGSLIPQFKYLLPSDHFNTFCFFNKEESSAAQIVVLVVSSSTGALNMNRGSLHAKRFQTYAHLRFKIQMN